MGAASVTLFLVTPRDSVPQVGSWFLPLVMAASLLALRIGRSPLRARGLLCLLLIGLSIYSAASVFWYVGPVVFGSKLPFPSVVDALYFAAYAFYAVFLFALLRRCLGGRVVDERIALLDSLLVTTALSAVLWIVVVEPQSADGASSIAMVVALAYPGFTLLLFALAVRLIITAGLVRSMPGVLLLTWVGAEVLGDVVYGAQSAGGTFVHGEPLSVTWMVSYTCLAALAAHPRMVTLLEQPADAPGSATGTARPAGRFSGTARLGLLLLCALVPIGLGTLRSDASVPLFAASAVSFALVTYRTGLMAGLLSEQRRLADELEEAFWRLRDQRDELCTYASIVASTDDAIITVSLEGTIIGWNHGAERLYGYSAGEAVGEPMSMIAAPGSPGMYDSALQQAADRGHVSLESMDARKDGEVVHTSVTVSRVDDPDGRTRGIVAISRDVTDRKRAEQKAQETARAIAEQARRLELLAFHDPVTGLGNRALLRQRAAVVDLRPDRTALLILDLDGFKEVNDTLGHAAGDALLLQVGNRLGGCVRTGDTVVRLGGDEFAVLLADTGGTAAAHTAERILTVLREPFFLDATAVALRGSIGIAPGSTGCDLDDLLRNADLAMYEAKAAGRDQARDFDPIMYRRASQRLKLDTELRTAIGENEFTVFYQPIVSAGTAEVTCVEALARWNHPQRGLVPPFEFVPAAERSGLIAALGQFVLRTACAQISEWRRDWPDLTVAVNVSQRELLDPDYAAGVEKALRDNALPGEALHLEITETIFAAEEDIGRALQALTALGVEFSIDDFGTGHSSLSRLRDLPVRRLKIDKSFIGELHEDGRAPLLSSIIDLAHSLDRVVVAEGVETRQQADFLVANGCDELQGYLYGRAVAAPYMVAVLRATGALGAGGVSSRTSPCPSDLVTLREPAVPSSGESQVC